MISKKDPCHAPFSRYPNTMFYSSCVAFPRSLVYTHHLLSIHMDHPPNQLIQPTTTFFFISFQQLLLCCCKYKVFLFSSQGSSVPSLALNASSKVPLKFGRSLHKHPEILHLIPAHAKKCLHPTKRFWGVSLLVCWNNNSQQYSIIPFLSSFTSSF